MIKLAQISSLENILPKFKQNFTPISELTVLKGERASYQIAYVMDNSGDYKFKLESDIKEHISLYKIGCVPVVRAIHTLEAMQDDNYISTEGGIYPDVLYPFTDDYIRAEFYYQGLWIETDEQVPAGEHTVRITIYNETESETCELKLEVLALELPPQKLIYSLNIHGDSVANYYDVEVFSEEWWSLFEKFVQISAKYGSDMLMIPAITPPVDTWIGGYRRTVQLVDIEKEGETYRFDFEKLHRFVKMCLKHGFRRFAMTHFFTQWGAECAAQVIATENGEKKRIFGWDVKSTDERYLNFLSQLLPALTEELKVLGIDRDTIFSVSDEPFDDETIARYAKLTAFMRPLLKGFTILDAFSNYDHFADSGASTPLIPTNVMNDFAGKVDDLSVYYCCAQDYKVSNRFISMPLYRNRCFGYQLYKYNVSCFYHWALNFYNAQLSVRPLDPFKETDAGGGFPGGDPFTVYPGSDGPIPSMRIIAFGEALQDLRALELLESFIGREETLRLIETVTGEITFENCARSANDMLVFRKAVNDKLREFVK